MSESEIIQYVTEYADKAHGQQMRKYTPERYIVHPVRVMAIVGAYNHDLPMRCAALLHDVLEDTPVTKDEMRIELGKVLDEKEVDRVVRLVVELTDVYVKSDYPRLNRVTRKEKEAMRLSKTSAEAQTIKYADIIDNINDHLAQDAEFARVYLREARAMLHVMTSGNSALREKAIALVNQSLLALKPAVS
jgi:(p)ppGpp synthase/HD superfamily hydrolase